MSYQLPHRHRAGILLQFLSPISWGFGLWLIYLNLQITGNACLTCPSQIGVEITTSPQGLFQTVVGFILFLVGIMLFISSIGLFSAKDDSQASRWLGWLGRWKPRWTGASEVLIEGGRYRTVTMATLPLVLFAAVLVIPGIGEDRQFTLSQFFDLWGTVWYFYVFTIGIIGFAFNYMKRTGGYFLSSILSLIAIGMVIPDLFGLLPPGPPSLRTWIILATQLPASLICVYASWRALVQASRTGW